MKGFKIVTLALLIFALLSITTAQGNGPSNVGPSGGHGKETGGPSGQQNGGPGAKGGQIGDGGPGH